jgi:hypothetical protein
MTRPIGGDLRRRLGTARPGPKIDEKVSPWLRDPGLQANLLKTKLADLLERRRVMTGR